VGAVLVFMVVLLPPPASAATPAPLTTFVTMHSEPGDHIGQGQQRLRTGAAATWSS
jgi:hypothetical protein